LKIHSLIQGSKEWLAYRANHFNASDAPAMMGVSSYKTRNQLLHELHTGLTQEVDAGTQRRFDDGHRFEALARPLAEKIIGEDLYPVTCSKGKKSASLDGLTMDEVIALEHKSLNDKLRAVMVVGSIGSDLPVEYQIQMEQQCEVTDAERVLFMASKWAVNGETGEYELVEERHCWYEPNAELRTSIIAGWAQFEKDLAAYVPVEVVEKPKAEAIMQLPALAIQIRGEVVLSNLPAFKAAADSYIANIKTDLDTDTDFANAEADVKFCKKAEEDLELTKAAAIAQTVSIDELMRTVDYIKDQLRDKRLMLDKLVTKRKAEIKDTIVLAARQAYAAHILECEKGIAPIRLTLSMPDFAGASKNKRTVASLQDGVDGELAAAKIVADRTTHELMEKIDWFNETHEAHKLLFADLQGLIYKEFDHFKLVVESRIKEYVTKEAEQAKAKASESVPAPQAVAVAQPSVTTTLTKVASTGVATFAANTSSSAPTISAIRKELNERLDKLGESELKRILSFVVSRYELQAA
jgi:putative phage-type endonuclease